MARAAALCGESTLTAPVVSGSQNPRGHIHGLPEPALGVGWSPSLNLCPCGLPKVECTLCCPD